MPLSTIVSSLDKHTSNALKKWKEFCYRPRDVPLGVAVKSLDTEHKLIVAKQSEMRKNEWTICHAGSSDPVVFVYAGDFAEAHPYETGNLVWGKSPIPDGLDEDRIARHASFKCAYSYAIETYHDKEIWELQASLDAFMEKASGFNARGVKRREWQNGSTWHWRYWFRVPMFLICENRGGARPDPPEGLHDWVVAAHKRSKMYRANPIRPEVCGLDGGRVHKIAECTPNVLEYGDIVSIVFTLTYVENREDWGPVPMVTNVVRVQRANRAAYPLPSTIVEPEPDMPNLGLSLGVVVDEEEAALADAAKLTAVEESPPSSSIAPTQDHPKTTPANAVAVAYTAQEEDTELPGEDFVVLEAEDADVSHAVTGKRTDRADADDTDEHGSHSGSEMDVDEDGEASQVAPHVTSGAEEGSTSSQASTLSLDSDDVQETTTLVHTGDRRRVRPRLGSDADVDTLVRPIRGRGIGASRRGGMRGRK